MVEVGRIGLNPLRVAVVAAVGLLIFRFWWAGRSRPQFQAGQRVRVTATITAEPVKVYQKAYVVVEGMAIEVPVTTDLSYGDGIVAVGTVTNKVPKVKNAHFSLLNEDFQILPAPPSFGSWLSNLRLELGFRLSRQLPRDEAALAGGILFGGSSGMSRSLLDSFRRTGTSHIIAASGYNISVVVGWTLLVLSRFFHRKLAIVFSLGSIPIYVLLAGATAAVVRAGIMAAVAWVGQLLGREGDGLWLLGLTGWAMLLVNPGYISDIGWQLSIAATAGILLFRPSGDFLTSIAAQVATLPLILHHFGNLSPLAPLANGLLLGLVPPIMQLTAVGLIAGPILFLAWPLLRLLTWSVTVLSSLPGASLTVGPIGWSWVIGYYVVVWAVWYRWWRPRRLFGPLS